MSDNPFSRALNPSIPLAVQVPQATGALGPGGMIDMMSHIASMRNALNQAQLFQQTFAARMRAGQIIAASPDIDTGIATIMKDPLIPGYAPEIMNSLRQMQLTEQQISGERQKQVLSAYDVAARSLLGGYQDPGNLANILKLNAGMLPSGPAGAQGRAMLNDLLTYVTDGADKAPTQEAALEKIRANIAGVVTAAGVPPSQQAGVIPQSFRETAGNRIIAGTQAPGAFGGGLAIAPDSSTGSQLLGVPPTLATAPGGGQTPYVDTTTGMGAGLTGGGLAAPQGAPQGAPQTPQGVSPVAPQQGSQTAPTIPQAGDGKPLFDPQTLTKIPLQGVIGGVAPTNKAIVEQNTHMQDEYAQNGQKDLTAARLTQGSIQEMKGEFNNLMTGAVDPKTGKPQANFLTMGAGAQWRTNMANLLNTTAGVIGVGSVVDPGKVASAEDIMKGTNRLGVQYTVSMLGGQREAASTIARLTGGAQPNINNTYAGGMLVSNMINAGAARQADWRHYQAAVMAANQGYMSNAAAADFDRTHPYSEYVNQAFEHFGADMGNAVRQGYMTRDDAASAMRIVASARAEAQREGGQ